MDLHTLHAKRYIEADTDTETSKMNHELIIQKDDDLDGSYDREVTISRRYERIDVQTWTKSKTKIYWETTWKGDLAGYHDHVGYLKDSTETSYAVYQDRYSLLFTDYEGDEAVSTRYYEDAFQNEYADIYDMGNYMQIITNDYNDYDEENDMIVSAPNLEGLLEQSYGMDNVPSQYDYSFIIEDGQINASNVLESEITLTLPGTYENGITSQFSAIKVSPSRGVYYADNVDNYPDTLPEGGAYYFIDSNGDSLHETVLITDNDHKVLSVGFDYTADGIFVPSARIPAEVEISETRSWSDAEEKYDPTVLSDYDFYEWFGHEEDGFEGTKLLDTFSDTMFDLWKMDFKGSHESQLAQEVKQYSADRFIEALTPEQVIGDVYRQVEAQGIGLIASIGFSAASWNPMVGFTLGYGVASIFQQFLGQGALDAYMTAQDFYYDYEEQTISETWIWDDIWNEAITTSVFGSYSAVTAPIQKVANGEKYFAELILANYGPLKTEFGTGKLLEPDLDYALQTRSFYTYVLNDLPAADPITREVLMPPEIRYQKNTYGYIEIEFDRITDDKEAKLNTLLPMNVKGAPVFEVADSMEFPSAPEFYINEPILVASDKYDDLSEDEKYYSLTKIYTGDKTLQLVKNKYRFDYEIQVDSISCVLNYQFPDGNWGKKEIEDLDEYHISNGILYIDTDRLDAILEDYYNQEYAYAEIILTLHMPKYSTSDEDMTDGEFSQIAGMQAIHASLLEYYYQFNLATQAQQRINELIYTSIITVASTAITLGLSCAFGNIAGKIGMGTLAAEGEKTTVRARVVGYLMNFKDITASSVAAACVKETAQETLLDPILESFLERGAEALGADAYGQIVASTLGQSMREGLSGIFSNQMDFYTYYMERVRSGDINNEMTLADLRTEYRQELQDQAIQKDLETSPSAKLLKGAAIAAALIIGVVGAFAFSPSLGALMGTLTLPNMIGMLKGNSLKEMLQYSISNEENTEISVMPDMNFGNPYDGLEEVMRESLLDLFESEIEKSWTEIEPDTYETWNFEIFEFAYSGGTVINRYEREFISDLMHIYLGEIFDADYDGDIMQPGFFEFHPEAALDGKRAALVVLGEKFSSWAGNYYEIGEGLFKEVWQKIAEFKQNTIDKMEHFFLYSVYITQQQQGLSLDAIARYRAAKGYKTREEISGKPEYDLIWTLQQIISDAVGRWVSLREMAISLYGRDENGAPLEDSFFHRRLQGPRQKFRQDLLGEMMAWIENPMSWTYRGKIISVKLMDKNLKEAKNAIYDYSDKVHKRNVYIIREGVNNYETLKFFSTLLTAYSKHPVININYPRGKGISFRNLFEHIGAYRTYLRYKNQGKPLSPKHVKRVLFKVHDDAIQLFAPREFQLILKSIKQLIPHWWITTFGIMKPDPNMIYYYKEYEPRIRNYKSYSLAQIKIYGEDFNNIFSKNKYYPGFIPIKDQPQDQFLKREQARIMLAQWGFRSPYDGRGIQIDKYGYPKESITAHHWRYKYYNEYNYYDCSIEALVPFPSDDHKASGVPHTPLWYERFKRAKDVLQSGKIPVPTWWSNANRIEYIKELIKLGFKKYIVLI